MKKIVRERFPIERLPKEVRDALPQWGDVRLEIEITNDNDERASLVAGSIRNVHGDEAETLAHIRALRDEE